MEGSQNRSRLSGLYRVSIQGSLSCLTDSGLLCHPLGLVVSRTTAIGCKRTYVTPADYELHDNSGIFVQVGSSELVTIMLWPPVSWAEYALINTEYFGSCC